MAEGSSIPEQGFGAGLEEGLGVGSTHAFCSLSEWTAGTAFPCRPTWCPGAVPQGATREKESPGERMLRSQGLENGGKRETKGLAPGRGRLAERSLKLT